MLTLQVHTHAVRRFDAVYEALTSLYEPYSNNTRTHSFTADLSNTNTTYYTLY
jgi:hypothetical protein